MIRFLAFLIALALLTPAAIAAERGPLVLAAATQKCDLTIGELVPNARVARKLAEAIISDRQTPEELSEYELEVEQDGQAGWIVYQSRPDSPPDATGNFVIIVGGGMSMRINRCNGEISNVHYQR